MTGLSLSLTVLIILTVNIVLMTYHSSIAIQEIELDQFKGKKVLYSIALIALVCLHGYMIGSIFPNHGFLKNPAEWQALFFFLYPILFTTIFFLISFDKKKERIAQMNRQSEERIMAGGR